MYQPKSNVQPSIFLLLLLLSVGAAACGDDAIVVGETTPDPDCDALLTPADFQAVCGEAITLSATGFEGIALNPCNRDASGDEGILLVTRHPSASVAAQGAEVAGGRGPTAQAGLGLYASAGSAGIFTVEVKATDDPAAICAPEDLPELLDIALSRVLPEGS
ncbi:MAG: hypothetical protein ACJAYU_002111 [Bradymonadia bacterium]|jgi:hypothetical protein